MRKVPVEALSLTAYSLDLKDGLDCGALQVAAAFSHFTFQDSGGQELCVDIQGVGTTWTDPQIHSLQKQFGIADLGRRGIDMFFMSHKCGPLCQKLLLSKPGILHGDEDRPRQPCVVCLDGPRRMLCQPCRHLCLCEAGLQSQCPVSVQCTARFLLGRSTCEACAVGLHRCPICRDPTTSIVWVADEQSGVSSTYIRESELDRMRHVDSGQKTEEAVFG